MSNIDVLKGNIANPARTYRWDVVFTDVIGGGDIDVLTVRCQSAAMPQRGFGEIVVPYKATGGVVYNGKESFGDHSWTCTYVEGEDRSVFNTINAWQQSIVSAEEGTGQGDESIKTTVYLRLLNSLEEESMSIRLEGAFPFSLDEVPLTYADDGIITHTIVWKYDRWIQIAANV